MKVLLFFIFVSIFSLQAKSSEEYIKKCQALVSERLTKYNQYRFKRQCSQIHSSYQFQCLNNVLNSRRAMSLVEFNACTFVDSQESLESIKDVTSYYNSTTTSFQVSLAALVKNKTERECLFRAIHNVGLSPMSVYECLNERSLDSLRTLAQIYLK